MKDDSALKAGEAHAGVARGRRVRLSAFAKGLVAALLISLALWALIYYGVRGLAGF